MYDPAEGTWRGIPPMHHRRQALGVAALHGRIYACGGYDGAQNLTSAERFDPSTGEWTRLQDMSVGRRWVALACQGSFLALFVRDFGVHWRGSKCLRARLSVRLQSAFVRFPPCRLGAVKPWHQTATCPLIPHWATGLAYSHMQEGCLI